MFKRLFIKILLVSLLLTSCVTHSTIEKPHWYSDQGANLSECGPTAAANALNWAGVHTNRLVMRSLNSRYWWRLSDIYSAISRNGVNIQYTNIANIDVIKSPAKIGIFYVNRNHFTIINYVNGQWVRYDSLYGVYKVEHIDIVKISWSTFITVNKR